MEEELTQPPVVEVEMEVVGRVESDVFEEVPCGEVVEEEEGRVREVIESTGTHSMWSAVANFVNSIVGAGIIGLPFSVEEGGVGFSLPLLILTGLLTAYSVRLIIQLGDKMRISDYELLCKSLLGTSGYYVVTLSMASFAYGAMLSYLIILGDTLYPVLSSWGISEYFGDSREVVILLFGAGICLPLSSFKDIGILARTSAVSVMAVFILVLIVIVRSTQIDGEFNDLESAGVEWMALTQPGSSWTVKTCQNSTISTKTSHGYQVNFTVPIDTLSDSNFVVHGGSILSSCLVDSPEADLFLKTVSLDVITNPTGRKTLQHPEITISWETGEDAQFTVDARATPYAGRSEGAYTVFHKNFFPAMGVIFFAYVCHHSSFLVRNSLKDPEDWPRVVSISIGIATFLSLLLSVAGYKAFLRCTRPNILNNFSPTDQVTNVARLLLALTMIFTFPMEFFVVRQAATTMFFPTGLSTTRHYVITLIIFALTLPPGILLSSDQLGLVLEISGGLAASALGFILPGLLWLSFRRQYTNKPPPNAERTYVPYDGPEGGEVVGAAAQTAPEVKPRFFSLLCTAEAVPPVLLLVIGVSSLCVNTVLGLMHAAGVDTYENPAFCPDLSEGDFL